MIKHKTDLIRFFGFDAITFGNHVFVSSRGYDDQRLLAHEQVHIDQYNREGFIRYIIKYIWFCIRYGYTNNLFEVEARELSKGKV